jgi:hypothetical protein
VQMYIYIYSDLWCNKFWLHCINEKYLFPALHWSTDPLHTDCTACMVYNISDWLFITMILLSISQREMTEKMCHWKKFTPFIFTERHDVQDLSLKKKKILPLLNCLSGKHFIWRSLFNDNGRCIIPEILVIFFLKFLNFFEFLVMVKSWFYMYNVYDLLYYFVLNFLKFNFFFF